MQLKLDIVSTYSKFYSLPGHHEFTPSIFACTPSCARLELEINLAFVY